MTVREIIGAWRDPAYRASLSEAERAQSPEHPAGMIELTGTALEAVAGGGGSKRGKSKPKKKKSSKSSRSKHSGGSSRSGKSKKSRRSSC